MRRSAARELRLQATGEPMRIQYDPFMPRRDDLDDPGGDCDDLIMEHERPSEAAQAAARTFEDEDDDDDDDGNMDNP